MRAGALAVVMALVAGCAGLPSPIPAPTAWGDRVPEAASEAVVARGSDSITLLPSSPSGAAVGVAYVYEMPHCGINSPIDVDGSFWDAVGVPPDSVVFDGRTGTFQLASHDEASFTAADGSILHLLRHPGAKEFRFCA